MRPHLRSLSVVLAFLACRSETSDNAPDSGGTIVIAMTAEPDQLVPPLIEVIQSKQVADLIFERLAAIGDDLNSVGDAGFRPQLAERWSWAPDSLSITFELSPKAKWHDARPVRASDVLFSFALNRDSVVASPHASLLRRIDSLTTPDSLSVVVWFKEKYPEQFYDAVHHVQIVPEQHLRDAPRATLRTATFGRAPVGSGRFRLARWDAGKRIELVADTANHRGRAKLDRVIFAMTPAPATALAQLVAGEVDVMENVGAPHAPEIAKNPQVAIVTGPSLSYTYIQFNLRDPNDPRRPHPLLSQREMRHALSMLVDRAQVVKSVMDSFGVVSRGPMTQAQPLADTSVAQIAYDTARAAAILDSLGWRRVAGREYREKNGRPLSFTLVVPNISQNRQRMAILVQEAFRRAGVELKIKELEPNAISQLVGSKKFDIAFWGTTSDVSVGGLRQAWTIEASRTANARNFGSYENRTFDAHLDSALRTASVPAARAHMREAFSTIVADAPAVWMYEARNATAIHRRFRTSGMQANAWWAGLAEWTVPPAERIDRDRIGLRMAAN